MGVSEYHHDEEVAAHECRVIDRNEAAACVASRIDRPAEIPQAMTDLGGQLRLIEVANPVGIFFWPAPPELADGSGQGAITALRISEPRQGACFHRAKVRRESSGRYPTRSCPGCPCEVGSFAESSRIGGLVAHRVENARAKQPVIASLGERERLNEVPLSERSARGAVVGHPRREKSRLSGS